MSSATLSSVGISLASTVPPEVLPATYHFIEQRGFQEIWVHEDCYFHGGFSAAATALQSTKSAKVGIGIVSAMVRHPAVTAMEATTLAHAHPGRLRLGIGHGAPSSMRELGVYPESPLRALREVVTSVRRLLAGDMLTQSGVFTFEGVRLAYPVADLPVYTGVIGPKSLALSADVADGTVVTVMAGPKYIESARRITTEAAAAAGRTNLHALPTLSYCFVDHDEKGARREARRVLAQMLARAGPDSLTSVYGIDDTLRDMIGRGGVRTVEAEMPEEWVDWFAAAGGAEHCLERIRALVGAGSTSVVLVLPDAKRVRSSIDLLANHVLPRL